MKGTMAALNMTMGILPKTLLWTLYCVSKIKLRWHINAFFGQKTDLHKKSVNLGMIRARHTTNRQSDLSL